MPDIELEVVTPERKVVETTVDEVVLPGKLGYLGVRLGHAPLLTSLGIGELSYVQGGRTHHLALAEGFAEVLPERVSVLTPACETSEEIDVARANASREQAQQALSGVKDASDREVREAGVRLHRAVNRIDVAGKGGGSK